MEHRWGQRHPIDRTVYIETAPQSINIARLTDVSISGAHLQCAVELPLFSRVRIQLNGPVDAMVMRQSVTGVGIEWCEFSHKALLPLIATTVSGSQQPNEAEHAPTYQEAI